jgi:hypothetical protein
MLLCLCRIQLLQANIPQISELWPILFFINKSRKSTLRNEFHKAGNIFMGKIIAVLSVAQPPQLIIHRV